MNGLLSFDSYLVDRLQDTFDKVELVPLAPQDVTTQVLAVIMSLTCCLLSLIDGGNAPWT